MTTSLFYRTILPLILVISHLSLAFADSQKLLITREASSNRVASIAIAPPTKFSRPGVLAARRAEPKESAKNFLTQHANRLGALSKESNFSLIGSSFDSLGMNHVRFSQRYKNTPVFGGDVLVHLDQDSQVRFVNGSPLETIKVDVNPKVSEQDAIIKANQFWVKSFAIFTPRVISASLYIWNKGLLEHRPDSDTRLVWKVHLYHDDSGSNENYFIDAHSGELIDQITGKNELDRAVADCSYGDGFCYRGVSIDGYVYGRTEGSSPSGPNPINLSRLDWPKQNIINSGGSLDTDHIYDSLGSIHNYYLTKFGLNGANRSGGIGDGVSSPASVTWARSLINWDGANTASCPNAFFSLNRLNFCLGLATLDVIAHEYAHAVQTYSIRDNFGDPSGLVYVGEQGALNEGHSDIFGEAVDNFATGSGNWLIGEGTIFTRSLSDPTQSSLPDRFYSPNYRCGTSDHGGVHTNLGVFTKAAYLISEGTQGVPFNGCSITGLGRDKEENIIFRAVNHYFTPFTGFNAARLLINQACADLYSVDDCANVAKALLAVQMNQAGKCSGQPEQPTSCAQLDDQCLNDPNKIAPGSCGCGMPDTNSDGDSLADCQDLCPADASKTSPGSCGCGALDSDTNSNSIPDCNDVQVQSIIPSKPILKAKKGSLYFTLAALDGVRYQLKVEILPRIKGGKRTTLRVKTKSFSGTIKNLPTGQVVVVTYSYLVDGNPPTLSAQSARARVRIK